MTNFEKKQIRKYECEIGRCKARLCNGRNHYVKMNKIAECEQRIALMKEKIDERNNRLEEDATNTKGA